MRFFPAARLLTDWIQEGRIGEIRLLQADFCISVPFDRTHRLYDRDLGGGALLDLGIYPLSLSTLLLGWPTEIQGVAQVGVTGVDESNAITLIYEGGAIAQLASSMRVFKPQTATIVGTHGRVDVHHQFYQPTRLTLHIQGKDPVDVSLPAKGNGYGYEIDEVHECLRAGKLESTRMPLEDTLGTLRLMDRLRAMWGVAYPGLDNQADSASRHR